MPGTGILYDDWKDYDNRKAREKSDQSMFRCNETWEINYLVSKIRKHHPFPEAAVRDAIASCCNGFPSYRRRAEFVHCIIEKLAEI